METKSQKSLVQPKKKHIPEDRLKTLSDPKTKAAIKAALKELQDIDEEMENVKDLAIAPNLAYQDNALVILVFLKKNDYVCRNFIQEIIVDAINCKEEEEVIILTTHKILNFFEEKLLRKEEYDKLLHASLPLQSFKAETNEELNKLFDEKYEKFLTSGSSESKIQAPEIVEKENELSKTDEQTPKFEIISLSLKDIAKEWNPKIKTYPEKKAEEKIKHLKSLAEHYEKQRKKQQQATISESLADPHTQEQLQKPQPVISEEEYNKILMGYKELLGIQKINLALHLAAAKFAPHQKEKLSIEKAMAIVKKLLGVAENLETEKLETENIKISSSREISDINCQDEEGKTALHFAAKSGGGIIYWLLVLKADPTIRDKNGKMFLDYIPNNWHLIKDSVKQYIKCWDQKREYERVTQNSNEK